jgi:hypothetical protein
MLVYWIFFLICQEDQASISGTDHFGSGMKYDKQGENGALCHRGLSSGLLKIKKKNLILRKIHLWKPSENNADKFQ